MITKNGVCYDLRESPFTFTWRGIVWFFSSASHREKFIHRVVAKEEWLDDSLSRRFKCSIHLPIVADVQLYTQVETRGFYCQTDDGVEYNTPSSIYVEANMLQIGVVNYGSI